MLILIVSFLVFVVAAVVGYMLQPYVWPFPWQRRR